MIRLLVTLALFLALHPAARPLPRDEQSLLAALERHAPPLIALDDVNGLGSAIPSRFTLTAPIAVEPLPRPARPFARVSRRWLESSRLLL